MCFVSAGSPAALSTQSVLSKAPLLGRPGWLAAQPSVLILQPANQMPLKAGLVPGGSCSLLALWEQATPGEPSLPGVYVQELSGGR